MRFGHIKQYCSPKYRQEVPFVRLLEHIKLHQNRHGLVLGAIDKCDWTKEQQVAYIEAVLQGCPVNRSIYLNHPGWEKDFRGDYILIDGRERLVTCMKFVQNEIPAFNTLYRDFEDGIPDYVSLVFCVHALKTTQEIKVWYKQLNPIVHANKDYCPD